MPTVTGTAAATAVAAPAAPKDLGLAHFQPTRVTLVRDGGSIVVNGNLNRSVTADVRLDGGLGSPTRGQFFVASHLWNEHATAGSERPMTKAELKQLKAAMGQFLSAVRLDKPTSQAYGTFMKQLDKALAGAGKAEPKVTKATTERLLKATNQALHKSSHKWTGSLPLGQRFVEVPLLSERHPDGFHYSAMVPVGALSPAAKPGDPNKATSFFIKRTGGFAGGTTYTGPISLK